MEMIVQVLGSLFHPLALGVNIFGVVLGIIFGAMPGLNGVVGVALLLPLTYGLSPANGLMMLGGLYMGATYGGSISAILLNCPGTGEAACTALNGNPLARQGRAMEALSYSALSSGIGGMFGLGATRPYTFFHIVLPNIKSGIASACIMAVINSFNNVSLSAFLTGPGVNMLPIEIMGYVEYHFDPTIAALATIMMVATLGVMLLIEKTLGLQSVV